MGVETTVKIIERIEERVSKEKYTSMNELNNILKDEIVKILAENSSDMMLLMFQRMLFLMLY